MSVPSGGLRRLWEEKSELELLLDGYDARQIRQRARPFPFWRKPAIGKSRLLYEFRKAVI